MSNHSIHVFIGKNVTWMLGQSGSIASDEGFKRSGASAAAAFFSTNSRYFRLGHTLMASLHLLQAQDSRKDASRLFLGEQPASVSRAVVVPTLRSRDAAPRQPQRLFWPARCSCSNCQTGLNQGRGGPNWQRSA